MQLQHISFNEIKKKEDYMTLEEITASNKQFLTPADVAEALGIDSQSLRNQVTKDASKVGFPVIRVGTRTKIPRDAFLKYIGGQ
jgi:NADH/NAD ratio-sensing transcriptional regulator Rex